MPADRSPDPEGGTPARRVIIDTDVGTDVDDLWALAVAAGRRDVVLEAVTVVYGDTDLRARLASVALDLLGLDVPVYRGREQTLSGRRILWAGHEGRDVPGIDSASYAAGDAVEQLVERAASEPGRLDLVAIGPLTNVAAAIALDPAFTTNIRHLTVMGGELATRWPEHNFAADITATRAVIDSGMAMTIMPLDQTLRVRIDRRDVERIARSSPAGNLLLDQTELLWQWLAGVGPGVAADASPAHDPCALLALLEPSLVTVTPMALTVDESARTLVGHLDASSPIGVVTDLDVDGMHRQVLEAMCQQPEST